MNQIKINPAYLILVFTAVGLLIARIVAANMVSDTLPLASARPKYIIWSIFVSSIFLLILFHILSCRNGRIIYFRTGTKLEKKIILFVLMIIFYNFFEFLNGIINGSPFNFLVGDTYKGILMPLGFFTTYFYVITRNTVQKLLWLFAITSVFPKFGPGDAGLLLSYAIGYKFIKNRKFSDIFLLLALLYTASIGKTTLIMLVLLLPLSVYILPNFRVRVLMTYILFFIIIICCIFLLNPNLIKRTAAYQKTVAALSQLNTDYTKLDTSTYQRVQETVLVVKKFNRYGNPFHFLFGFGNGAMYRAEGLPKGPQTMLDLKYGGYAHHIHINPIFIFHQWGVCGILIFGWLIFVLFLWAKRIKKELKQTINKNEYFFCVVSYLMFISAIIYGVVNPPKTMLLYEGMLLGLISRKKFI